MNEHRFLTTTIPTKDHPCNETEDTIEWHTYLWLGSGFCASEPDCYNNAKILQKEWMEKQQTLVSLVSKPMAPHDPSKMVPTPLTITQREQLYKLIYGECTKHVWPTGLDLLTILHND